VETQLQIRKLKTVKIFKTNIRNVKDAAEILISLLAIYPLYKINFDLDDIDNILRIEAEQIEIEPDNIIGYMVDLGYCCEELK